MFLPCVKPGILDDIISRLLNDCLMILILTLFKMGAKKASPTSFSPVTSTNVGISPQKFLMFSFNPSATLVQNFKATPSAIPKLLDLNQDHPSEKYFFWSNPYKIKFKITSLIEMLELPKFGHMTTPTI